MQPAVFKDVLLDVVMFPVWWYTQGLLKMGKWLRESIFGYAHLLAINVWMKNLFVPMFGQYDWQSRLISIFMRSVQIVGRTVALLAIVFALVVVSLLYVAAWPLVLSFVAYHLLGSLLYA